MIHRKRIILTVLLSIVAVCVLFSAALVMYSVWQNQTIRVTHYAISHEDIPAAFDGKRIVQLTDLHNKDFGDELTRLVAAQQPDIIVITGDWISKDDTNITAAQEQAAALIGIAPIYYVAGNHEARSSLYDELEAHLRDLGITILENEAMMWEENGERVQLLGVFDPQFHTSRWHDLASLVEQDMYAILLFHRPQYMEEAVTSGADLILSGHTHGGQIRLPLIGALYAPDQGFFPAYDVGLFEMNGASMIIGQGLGESTCMRILTPPEVVVVTLSATM